MSQAVSINLELWHPPPGPAQDNPQAIIDWAVNRFDRHSSVMTTSFGMEGIALLDMLAAHLSELRVIYVDTDFLFEETHQLRLQLQERFKSIQFEAARPLLAPDEQASVYGEELWSSNPDLCCKIRKVEPLSRALQGADVWFTALRRSQSATRHAIKIVDWDWQYQLIKICPLASWSRGQVYDYVMSRGLPYNELHDQGYPTVGCTHCTKPVSGARPWEYSREGRWNGNGKTECGMHGAGI